MGAAGWYALGVVSPFVILSLFAAAAEGAERAKRWTKRDADKGEQS